MTSHPQPAERVIARIKAEHRALARVIGAMQAWISRAREAGAAPDAPLFEAMLRYVREVPDRLHHPQEDEHLFPALQGVAAAAAVIAQLEREHAAGAAQLADVAAAFAALQAREANAINRLTTAVDDFAEFYWNHMRVEEESLLPLAAASLSAAAWERIEASFEAVHDPLFAATPAGEYRALYRFISERSPPSIRGYLDQAAGTRP